LQNLLPIKLTAIWKYPTKKCLVNTLFIAKVKLSACSVTINYLSKLPKLKKISEDIAEAPPYPGAKPFFLIADKVEDREWLSKLIELTENDLPMPKPKKKKKKKT